jgi:hypothetical protein
LREILGLLAAPTPQLPRNSRPSLAPAAKPNLFEL